MFPPETQSADRDSRAVKTVPCMLGIGGIDQGGKETKRDEEVKRFVRRWPPIYDFGGKKIVGARCLEQETALLVSQTNQTDGTI